MSRQLPVFVGLMEGRKAMENDTEKEMERDEKSKAGQETDI